MGASPALRGALKRPFDQQVAFFRQKLGTLLPTQRWDDVWQAQHDRAFMVAGAMKADLLADLAAAVDRSIAEGGSIEAFRKDFKDAVRRAGWDFNGEFNWRTRIIYRTNAATSYAAGRTAQLREGGFPFLMYKHGGSADPRPQHLAWDGLVLPADDPFWAAHTPPNGWGCSCRVVGLRSREAARRLGGDPDKPRPADWDRLDPKTGAPVGIDKGWAYRPGETVADAVQAMAAKTVQWPYELAKAYMAGVPEGVRDELAAAYRRLPSLADDLRRYAQRVLDGGAAEVAPYRSLGLLTGAQQRRIGQLLGADLAGFDFALDAAAVRHVLKEHGDVKAEQARGQRAVTAADYARLPGVVQRPEAMEAVGRSWRSGNPLVEIRGALGEDRLVAVFELRRGRRMLALDSMYVRRR